MPTIAGLRRRGYTPEAMQLFCERIGVAKDYSWIDYATLDGALRDDLEGKAPRAMAVLEPLRLMLTNWKDVFGSEAHREPCQRTGPPAAARTRPARVQPRPRAVDRADDFEEVPLKGYHRLSPPRFGDDGAKVEGTLVRLKYGYVVECTGVEKNFAGEVEAVYATSCPTPRAARPAPMRSRSRA